MDLLSGDGAVVGALLVLRLTGLVMVAPVFSARVVPMRVRTALLVLLTLLLWPAAVETAGPGVALGVATALTEALIGMVVGLGAAVFVAAGEMAGDLLAIQMGLSGANLVDPMSQTQMAVLGQFLGLAIVTILVSLGGHVAVLDALASSLRVLPAGGPVRDAGGLVAVLETGRALFVLGLRFAAPVVAAVMIGNAALGVVARTVPQLNVLMVAFPLQIALGLFTLAVSLPLVGTFFSQWEPNYLNLMERLFGGLAPGVGG